MTPSTKLKDGLKVLNERLSSKNQADGLDLEATRERLETYQKCIEGLKGATVLAAVDREIKTTKAFLTYSQMRLADSSFFDEVREGDIIEIISLKHQHLFCSPNFFDISSYDVETLMGVPWENLFRRDLRNTEDLISLVNLVLESRKGKVKGPNSKHLLFECYPEDRYAYEFQCRWLGCVLEEETDRVAGYATIISAQRVGEASKFQFLHEK